MLGHSLFSYADSPRSYAIRDNGMTRRKFLRLSAGGGLVLLSSGVAWLGGEPSLSLFRASQTAMGTQATILLAHSSRKIADTALQAAFADIAQVERRMSRFRVDSDVGRLNTYRNHWTEVTPSTAAVLLTALDIARTTDGHFDPCLDDLMTAWGFHDHNYPDSIPQVPSGSVHIGEAFYRGLIHRRTKGRHWFRLAAQSPGIDLGGIAKGYAIDQAAARLREADVRHALVNVGDDVFALGVHPSGEPWRIGLRHPRRPGTILQVLALQDQAVATSGDYANFFFRAGRRYAHLLDPHTGQPADTHQSLTVIASTAMLADALATAAFTVDPVKVPHLLTRTGAEAWLAVDAAGHQYGVYEDASPRGVRTLVNFG